jgi:hypothetical protein
MAYECILLKAALRFLDKQTTPHEREHVIEILDRISNDPLPDGITKFYFLAAPAVFTIYKDAAWWVLYYSPRDNVLHIINIGRLGEPIHVHNPS